MTILRQCLTDYLSVRRAVGFQLTHRSHQLADFVGFLQRAGATTITTQLALVWTTQTSAGMNCRADRLSAVRGFARYLQAIEPSTEVPPSHLLPRGSTRATPYIYNDTEISALMAATHTLHSPTARCLLATLIGLLSATGMRPGEALGLDREDIDWEHGILTVRRGKFGKSREVALHPTTISALERYSRSRDELIPHPSGPSFFVSRVGARPNHQAADRTFRQLARRAGLPHLSSRSCPRLHDFRHTFAVRTVLDWYRDGLDVAVRLPLLSTYLGHVRKALRELAGSLRGHAVHGAWAENAFSTTGSICHQVCRWRNGAQAMRWATLALLKAEGFGRAASAEAMVVLARAIARHLDEANPIAVAG